MRASIGAAPALTQFLQHTFSFEGGNMYDDGWPSAYPPFYDPSWPNDTDMPATVSRPVTTFLPDGSIGTVNMNIPCYYL